MKTAEIKKTEKLTASNIVMVRIYMPDGRDQFHFFGSISAVYEVFNRRQLGVALSTLYSFKLTEDHPYIGFRCEIHKGKLLRKRQEKSW